MGRICANERELIIMGESTNPNDNEMSLWGVW